ncbi:DegV family protein [Dehalobacterium formicoaceticum]|uniref:DegV family protein n=1 Tax=Dehalobacterium formicoaceticum TaxID=51515 RepID=A0ABT1XZH7_9FIRM|nr:DegV family protein [Dehalobacterium formicoaceticum]
MVRKIALVTDSTSDLTADYVRQHNIHVIPLKVVYRDRDYLDRVEIQPQQIYERLEQEVPTTSMPSVGEVSNFYAQLIKEGYEEILSIHISSGLSGTVNSARLAADNFPYTNIEVVDSRTISMGTGLLVQQAADFIKQGVSLESIVAKLQEIRAHISVIFIVKTLEYLKKGGRIGYVSATMGSLLDLKPIIAVNEEGKYFTMAKIRGRKRSLEKILELAKEAAEKQRLKLIVMHGDALEEARYIFNELKKSSRFKDISLGEVGPVIGVHTGPGVVGIVFRPV